MTSISVPSARNPGVAKGNLTADIRTRLRLVTAAAHERMHSHSGFAAAAAGRISLSDYRLLLSRLFGFHRAFETVRADSRYDDGISERARSHLIAADLQSLGLDASAILRLPLCNSLQAPANAAEQLGGLYVLEGSTLGGVQIARALQSIVPGVDGRGRRFFLGYGARHGAMWRAFVERLEGLATEPSAICYAERAAVKTFDEFEHWMSGWKALGSTSADVLFDLKTE
jgi:heme oxygenase